MLMFRDVVEKSEVPGYVRLVLFLACAVKAHFAPPDGGGVEPLPTPVNTGRGETRKSLRERPSFITDLPKAEKEKWMDRYKCMPD